MSARNNEPGFSSLERQLFWAFGVRCEGGSLDFRLLPNQVRHAEGKMRQNPEFFFNIIVVRLPMALLGGLAGFTLAIAQPQQSGPTRTSQNSQAPYVAQYEG